MPVVRAERDGHPVDRFPDDVPEHLVGVNHFLLGLLLVKAPPVPVGPTVRTDGHSGPLEFLDAGGVQPSGLAEEARQDEEVGLQSTLDQPGKRDVEVGGVAVVEGEADVRPVGHRLQHLFELADAHPRRVLVGLQTAGG
jgi:hypothetical protein